jgi:hypothetical protein
MVAAGLAEKDWTVAEMAERTANYSKPGPPQDDWAKFLETIPDDE